MGIGAWLTCNATPHTLTSGLQQNAPILCCSAADQVDRSAPPERSKALEESAEGSLRRVQRRLYLTWTPRSAAIDEARYGQRAGIG